MLIELYIFAFIIITYGIFTTLALMGFGRLKEKIKETTVINSFISIVISARNEEVSIEECLKQIIKQKFPTQNFELVLIDDASEDNTVSIAEKNSAKFRFILSVDKAKKASRKKTKLISSHSISKGFNYYYFGCGCNIPKPTLAANHI